MKRMMATGLVLGFAAVMSWGVMSGVALGKKPAPKKDDPPAETPAPAPAAPADTGGTGISVPTNATQLDAASKMLSQSQTEYAAFVAGQKTSFEAGDTYQAAKKAVDDDQKALSAAEAPLQEKLKGTDERYAAAVAGLDDMKKKLDEAVASKKVDDITFRKYDVDHAEEVISKAETPVFSKDAGVTTAQAKLDADTKVLATMQGKFMEFLNANADYVALQRALANAQSRVAALKSVAGPQ